MTYITIRKPRLSPFKYYNSYFRPYNIYTKPTTSNWKPSVDFTETEDGYMVRAELPGVARDDVSISVKDNLLTISGEKPQEDYDESKFYRQTENSYGSFERSFSLPPKIVPDSITAQYRDGVLTLSIPKPEEVKPREIPIESDSSGE
ncbi:Hsp20/alpha crystallin family protein [Candidatus Poribacteria bacterium]|nr:Hsp20/alpha crystallin family protein [Candidatus Poribacteria bacterium]